MCFIYTERKEARQRRGKVRTKGKGKQMKMRAFPGHAFWEQNVSHME